MKTPLLILTATVLMGGGLSASAQTAKPADNMKGMAMPASATKTGKGTGEITGIDAKAGTLTIKHTAIAALGWPAMTMSFKANPPSLLKGLKPGQKIGFDAKQGMGLPEVTAIRRP